MTKSDALVYFPYNEEDDLEELYEERLFEFKQFFLSRPPSIRAFSGRIKKMNQMHEAYVLIAQKEPETYDLDKERGYDRPLEVKPSFLRFLEIENKLKWLLSNAISAVTVTKVLNRLVENRIAFAGLWPKTSEGDVESHKWLDPMEMLALIDQFNEQGFRYFSEIPQLSETNVLRQEGNRLSLWMKLEQKWQNDSKN